MRTRRTHQRVYGGVEADLRETERRRKLLAAGLEAFGTRGYARTNIRTICRLAGLTERYFYESFANKEALLSAVYQELVDDQTKQALAILESMGSEPVEATEAVLRMFLKTYEDDHHKAQVQLFEILGVSPEIDRQYRDAMKLLADMVRLFMSRAFPGIPEGAWEGSIVPTGLAGSVILITHEWVLDGFVTPLDSIVDQCTDIFLAMGRHLEAGSGNARKV